MSQQCKFTAEEVIAHLKEGNAKFLERHNSPEDVLPPIREKPSTEGQSPHAVILTCSDSRIIPEDIFSAGVGELFVIRVAGFVAEKTQLGSIEYAVDHLGTPLVVVLGHTHCGAVTAALEHRHTVKGALKILVDEISAAIGDEKDPHEALKLNVQHSCKVIEEGNIPAKVIGAIYHLHSGEVEFL